MVKKILLLSFIEGACVMAVELLGAKMMAPFYGSSLYVWATVLAITLLALTSGYFIGGIISEKKNPEQKLYLSALAGGLFMLLMPMLCNWLFNMFGSWRLIPATVITASSLLFPPVFLMGMVSPLIITIIGDKFNKPGRAAGLIYAISTLGGILSTFLCGFYIIPTFGLKWPCMMFGLVLMIIPAISLFKLKNSNGIALTVFGLVFFFSQFFTQTKPITGVNILSKQEGILGQIMVIDFPKTYDTTNFQGKYLVVNRIIQTAEDSRLNHFPYLKYVNEIDTVLKTINLNKGNATINGLGGGSIAKMLCQKKFNIKAVELDERIVNVAKEFFNLPSNVKTIVDDARHYLNMESQKQDLVIFDMFKGEENPGHVLTTESFNKLNSLLNNEGIFIINTNGYTTGRNGKGNRSIVKTIEKSGFKAYVLPVEKKIISEDFRNILIIGVKEKNTQSQTLIEETFRNDLIYFNENELANATVLTDDLPVLDHINAGAARLWRYYYIKNTSAYFNSLGIPMFE